MAARKKTRQREAQLAFEALSIEGGLLSPDWLARAAQVGAGGQSESDYRIPKGLTLRDEIGRYWRIAQAHWSEFAAGRAGGAAPGALAERFVQALLRDSFGFASLSPVSPVVIAEHSYPVGFSGLGKRVPVVIAPAGSGLDALSSAFGDNGRRRSAFGLAQEFLNAEDGALWGLATDGVALRIVRDNASLTRPAWIEVDLGRIFTEERYADFAALWLLVHETRFGRPEQPVTECALESWRNAGREEGTRAREHLRRGVEDALIALGHGFLAHPDNQALRAALQSGSLATKDYFNQLLRLIYRLIFMLTVEERGMLHPDGADEKAKTLYGEGYSLRRLRERSVKRSAHDRFADLWETTTIVFRGVETGEPRLGLPALAGIFAKDQCAAIDAAKLENRALLHAVFTLAWLREDGSLARVNWRDMGPEELGSVYESLLELVPQITKDGRQFGFATGGETKGNARKTTGSYYTPDSLVQVLLDSALEPVIADTIARNPERPIGALLELSIVDPACGSGHFLLAAARRLAAHVARLQANGTPAVAEYRHALRQVVGHCIYGVDLNPMAVELCKVSLWMEAVEPGLPLTFLNSHIQHGNALLGTTPELMAKGIPDAAWDPIEGDDRKTASALKKRNKGERTTPNLAFEFSNVAEGATIAILSRVQALDSAPDLEAIDVERKATTWRDLLVSEQFRMRRLAADAWCAAFVWPKQPGDLASVAPTHEVWERLRHALESGPPNLINEVDRCATEYGFFHWHLQFPQVFAKGGFDAVLGNPPWERVKLQEQEFFAARGEQIANAPNAAARKKLIANLADEDPRLWTEWSIASRKAEGEGHLIRQSGRYPLCGKGDVNTYAIFAEHNLNIVGPRGRAGFIVPSGIATDDTTKEYFGSLVGNGRLSSIYDFRNHDGLFYDVGHRRFKFCLLTILGRSTERTNARLVFFAESASDVLDPDRQFTLSPSELSLLNPNTRTCPTFRSQRDAAINLAIYRSAGVLWREDDEEHGNPWDLRFMAMLHMAGDSGLFKTRAELEAMGQVLTGSHFRGQYGEFLPLVEAKMVHHFDHRYGDYAAKPPGSLDTQLPDVPTEQLADPLYEPLSRYWVAEAEVAKRLGEDSTLGWLLGWRDICRSTDERTVIASVIPRAAVGHTTPLMFTKIAPPLVACLYASLSSFALDYAARQKVGGTHLTYSYLKQLPVLRPSVYSSDTSWRRGIAISEWLLPPVLELTYTAWDLEAFARDVGYDGPPFRWDPERRFLLRCELDAVFFHLYGLSRGDTDYVMDTFPIVRKNDLKAHAEFRTKRVILEIYDAMADAARTGKPYQTRLDPPPADLAIAHPPRGADIIAFPKPARVRRSIPPWGPSVLPAAAAAAGISLTVGTFATSLSGEELGMSALAGALRQLPSASARADVEHAVVLALLPRLLQRHLPTSSVKQWRALVGDSNLAVASVVSFQIPWTIVIRKALQQQVLQETPQGLWAAGPDIDDVPPSALDARALMAVAWLATAPAQDTDVDQQLREFRAA
jgi:hypothetical protein